MVRVQGGLLHKTVLFKQTDILYTRSKFWYNLCIRYRARCSNWDCGKREREVAK